MDATEQKSSFKSRLRSALSVRGLAWLIGLSLVVGSIIYFTGGQGGGYKGLAIPDEKPLLPGGTDAHSCSEWEQIFETSWMNFINSENLQKAQENYLTYGSNTNVYLQGPTCPSGTIVTSYIDPEMSLPKQHLENAKNTCDQFVNDLETAITDKTLDKYTEAYEKTGTLLGKDNTVLKDFCLDDSQKQKYSDAKTSLEQEKNTAVLMKNKSFLSGSSMALGGVAETAAVSPESLRTEAEPPESEDASPPTPDQTEESTERGLRGEAVDTETATAEKTGREESRETSSVPQESGEESTERGLRGEAREADTDTAKDNMIANADKCTTAKMQLGQAKSDFDANPTQRNLDVFTNLLETNAECDLSAYQAMTSDMKAKIQANTENKCAEFKIQLKSAIDSFYADMAEENLSKFTTMKENRSAECDISDYVKQLPAMESRLATCQDTQKVLQDLRTAFDADQTITMENLDKYKLTLDSAQQGCDVAEYQESFAEMEANATIEEPDILALTLPEPEPALEPEPEVTLPEPEPELLPVEPEPVEEEPPAEEHDIIVEENVVAFEPETEPEEKLEEKLTKKLGHKLPAWGAEGEWEKTQPEPVKIITEETPKTVQTEKTQSEQKSYSAQPASAPAASVSVAAKQTAAAKKTTKKTKRPSAAKRVSETTGTGPETLIYLLVAAASYGASRIARKRK